MNDRATDDGTYVGRGFMGWIGTNYEVNPADSNHIIAQAWDSGRLIQSRDGGESWTRAIEQATSNVSANERELATDSTDRQMPRIDGYEFGVTPTNVDPVDAVEAWSAWKNLYLTRNGVPNSDSMLRVSHEPNGLGRSSGEFQGYGMLFAAHLEPNDSVLQQLWNYASHYLNDDGLMPWNISADGVVEGPSAALDGDVDIAMALEVAERRWPGQGWGERARTYMDNMLKPPQRSHLKTSPIDTSIWPRWKKGIYLNYLATGYFEAFAQRTGDDRWTEVAIPNTYDLLDKSFNDFALPAWFVDVDGSPVRPDDPWNSRYNRHDAGATRTDWRIATHALLTGHPSASAWSQKLTSFFLDAGSQDKRGNAQPFSPTNLRSGYRFAADNNYSAGQPYGNPNLISETMITAAGVSAMASGNQSMADSIYDFMASDTVQATDGNMDNAMHVMGLLLMGGYLSADWSSDTPTTVTFDTPDISPFGGGEDVAFATDGQTVFAALGQATDNRPTIARSNDAGRTWSNLPLPQELTVIPESIYVNSGDANDVWFVTQRGLFQSTNANTLDPNAVEWTKTANFEDTRLFRMEADPHVVGGFYLTTEVGVFRFDGNEFAALGGPVNSNQGADMKLAVDPAVEGRIYVANFSSYNGQQRGLWKLEGETWIQVFNDNWVRDIAIDPINVGRLALVTDKAPFGDTIGATGVWISDDYGQTWEATNEGLPMLRGQHISFSPQGDQLVVGLTGRGFYKASAQFDDSPPTASIPRIVAGQSPNAIDIVFNEPVTGFDLEDLELTRYGQAIDLSPATLKQISDAHYQLDQLGSVIKKDGNYELSLEAGTAAISDLAGNPMVQDTSRLFGIRGVAYDFDRSLRQSVILENTSTVQVSEGSIEFEFTANSKARGTLFSKDSRGTNNGDVTIEFSRRRVQVQFVSGGTTHLLSSSILSLNERHRVQLRFGTAGLRLTVNGEQVDAEPTAIGGLNDNAGDIVLGASAFKSSLNDNNRLTRYFDGTIQELEIRGSRNELLFANLETGYAKAR